MEVKVDTHKPYYGQISDVTLISSYTGHLHANGLCPTHPLYNIVNTSRIIRVDLYENDKYAEFETKNSRYGLRGDDYETMKFFLTSDETEEAREEAEIDFTFFLEK